MIRPLLACGAASAAVPILAAKCPNGLTADSDSKGRIYVSGKLAKVINRPDGQITAQSAGVYGDIMSQGDQPARITCTAKDKSFGPCDVVAFKAPDGAPAGAPPDQREPSAALVTASLVIASRAPQSTKFLGISLVVSGVFMGVGFVLFGIQRHGAAAVAAVRGQRGESAEQAAMHLRRLVTYLVAGGGLVCAVLGILTYAILARIDQGFAVFG